MTGAQGSGRRQITRSQGWGDTQQRMGPRHPGQWGGQVTGTGTRWGKEQMKGPECPGRGVTWDSQTPKGEEMRKDTPADTWGHIRSYHQGGGEKSCPTRAGPEGWQGGGAEEPRGGGREAGARVRGRGPRLSSTAGRGGAGTGPRRRGGAGRGRTQASRQTRRRDPGVRGGPGVGEGRGTRESGLPGGGRAPGG